ncbi:52 kDa repressor of the inhibitor of the protein kinase-like [Hydractinia symbiolongicarpus]|uniref:52 kDa repressor of the inhibitor of the protein kinase-like n=1 Tax=Hydractinia symbiolongicarpus TaxID=13093 RepID=UPI0025504CC2|nr:52 kDa repressor of the inhibitor of the protein kinase-like [Hydractinia symbiolongicarpus]
MNGILKSEEKTPKTSVGLQLQMNRILKPRRKTPKTTAGKFYINLCAAKGVSFFFNMDSLDQEYTVEEAFKSNDLNKLNELYAKLKKEILDSATFSDNERINNVGKKYFRDLVAETFIPTFAKDKFIALKSQASGNCLYSSVSLFLCGDNSLVRKLRTLTSLELYLNSGFYIKHPTIISAYEKGKGVYFNNFRNILGGLLVSHAALDSGKTADALIKVEAMHNIKNFEWCSFVCVLALSSAISRNIITLYPDCGHAKLKLLYSQNIEPRDSAVSSTSLHILLCYCGTLPTQIEFKHNHFVPLLCGVHPKRKIKQPLPKPVIKKNKQSKLPFWVNRHGMNDLGIASDRPTVTFPAVNMSTKTKNIPMSSSSTVKSVTSISPVTKQSSGGAISSIISVSTEITLANDIASYMNKVQNMEYSEIIKLINEVFIPDNNYKFPVKDGRSFKFDWLKQYTWLCYSPAYDGGYCLPCVLFGNKFPNLLKNIRNLVTQPVNAKRCATTLFKNHEKTSSSVKSLHQATFSLFTTYLSQHSGKSKPISELVDQQISKQISENKAKLEPIIDTILLCGRLNIPLRGHRDDSSYHPEVGSYSSGGVGNFIEILNYRARANPVFKETLDNSAKNATYISKTAQNELINCIGEVITEKIVLEIKGSKFFSILGDECMDSSCKEQFSLCIRFVDQNCDVREEFLRLVHCGEGLSGDGLCKIVLKCLAEDLQLNIMDCRGQGYDGAGSVAGFRNGLAARILRINRKALYTHCHSHRLNLAICKTCGIQAVENVMGQIRDISFFFNYSETRRLILERNIKEHCPSATKYKLFNVCATRWVERIKGMEVFNDLYVAIVNTLDEMNLNLNHVCNADTSSKALPFLKVLTSFDFMATFMITKNIFLMTLQVTELLQSRANDIMDGIHMIDALKSRTTMVRNNIDYYHEKWYKEASDLAKELHVTEASPRTSGITLFRSNTPSENPSDHYKRNITIPMLDHLHSELTGRFEEKALSCYSGLAILPEKMLSLIKENVDWKKRFNAFFQFYLEDLPNVQSIEHELELWEIYWKSYEGPIPNNISSTLKSVNFTGFENVKVALRILATLPVTSCECERTFSAMKRLKTFTRTTMDSDRLNGLALMHVHQNIIPNISDFIEKFSLKNRRLNFK